jgi:hypothetical protein
VTGEAVATYLRRVEQLRQQSESTPELSLRKPLLRLIREFKLGGRLNVGSWLISAFALALVVLGRAACGNGHLRRIVGILWDIGQFRLRATAPA